jgi:hypothetical protein
LASSNDIVAGLYGTAGVGRPSLNLGRRPHDSGRPVWRHPLLYATSKWPDGLFFHNASLAGLSVTTRGGIAGIRGYDVQSTVILDLILTAFGHFPPSLRMRPEGLDDLVITWIDPSTSLQRQRFYQIKKASDDPDAEWTLADIARELLGSAFAKLAGNDSEQRWILGDKVAADVDKLLAAGQRAAQSQRELYLTVLHRLAKAETEISTEMTGKAKYQLDRWTPVSVSESLTDDVENMVNGFAALDVGLPPAAFESYRQTVTALNAHLPNVLGRITAHSVFGTEAQISERVKAALTTQYHLDADSVNSVVFRNLRGFINDVSKEPGLTITRDDFERELVEVWPHLLVPTQPRPNGIDYVRRPQLVMAIREPALAMEVIGPSGAGKSSLASEIYDAIASDASDAVVLFAEIRSSTSLRDLLVGVAYSLHRRRVTDLIGPALNLRTSDTSAIEAVAATLGGLSRVVVLLIDVADRDVSVEFQRDLVVFVRALKGSRFALMTFSQASVFRELSEIERNSLGIRRHSIPGLHWGEVSALTKRRHPGIDMSAVFAVFEKLTSGLASGLLPTLATELARSRSLAEMEMLASKPPEHRLTAAHQAHFYSIPAAVRDAAYRIVCLSLPLSARDLTELFQADPINSALIALAQEGLLPPYDDGVEMHETVRSGLESLVPVAVARETHQSLADYFERREMWSARIHHLERAGSAGEAWTLARNRFLAGHDWPELAEYVGAKQCVTATEVVGLLIDGHHQNAYVLPDLLKRVKTADTGTMLLDAVRSDPGRYQREYQWAWRIQEALLKADPSALTALVRFALELPGESRRSGRDQVSSLLTAARRSGIGADEQFVRWFHTVSVDYKEKIVGFLLLRPELSRVKEAFALMQTSGIGLRSRSTYAVDSPTFDLNTHADIDTFLEGIPAVEPSQMLLARSALLDPFGDFVWSEREVLRAHCRELLRDYSAATPALDGAIRVLIYLNDVEVVALTREFRDGDDRLASLGWMTPALLGFREELPILEAKALDPRSTSNTRCMAILIASQLGADTGSLMTRAIAVHPADKRGLEFLLLMQASFAPFPEVVPLLEAALASGDSKLHDLLGATLTRTADAAFPGSDALLVSALRSPSSRLILVALMALQKRRLGSAFDSIIALACDRPELAAPAVPAAAASGPVSVEPFEKVWPVASVTNYWRWILAGRLKDVTDAEALTAVANNSDERWKIRRLAILAAGRLPYAAALEAIAPAVLALPDLLPDESFGFQNHSMLSTLIEASGVEALLSRFLRGRNGFVKAVAPIYDEHTQELIDKSGILGGGEAVGWLWDRLESYGFASDVTALTRVENDIHVPLLHGAAFRSLRMQGRQADLFTAFEQATSDWIRLRSFLELCRGGPLSADDEHHAETLLATAEGPRLKIALTQAFGGRRRRNPERAGTRPAETTPTRPLNRMAAGEAWAFIGSSERLDSRPLVLDLAEEELRDLVTELSPERDTRWLSRANGNPGRVSLSESGWRLRGGSALEPNSPHYEQRSILRPALAAANRFGICIPWHRAQLTSELGSSYADRFFASLGALGNRDRFLAELNQNADAIVPLLDRPERASAIAHLVDERVLSVLARYVDSGPPRFFQALCILLCEVKEPVVRPVLATLFRRWLMLLDQLQSRKSRFDPNRAEWRAVWQTFSLLKRHPQFKSIPQVASRLLDVLTRHELHWVNKHDILAILKDEPSAYIRFEYSVVHSVVFEHYPQDEVDEYDTAADTLFRLASG